jgi:pimeloyl-ACP methyl ester carboxylesterase
MVFEYDGIKIYYETDGTGDGAVLFLHGWGGNRDSMRGLYSRLSHRYRVITPDFPFFGGSGRPGRAYGVADYAAAVAALMNEISAGRSGGKPVQAEQLNADIRQSAAERGGGTPVQPITIIGHSFGGRVGIVLASRFPDTVGRLILINSAGMKPRRGIRYFCRVARFKFARLCVKLKLRRAAVLQRFGSDDYRAADGVMRGSFVKVVNEYLEEDARKITVPTLIISGTNDTAAPPSSAKKLHRLIADSRLKIFDGAGHFSYLDKPNEVYTLIDKFLMGS